MAGEQRPDLDRYRRKRSAERTPEPFGGEGHARPRLFVVQKHAARRLHYDFRLEYGGVLWSWAVPRGPSLDPSEKRLAVHVEDHPVEYADFQGVIPAGNYGAGAVIVWDKGLWLPLEDPHDGIAQGKLTFELRGYKLRGAWHLFRTGRKSQSGKADEWLLVKRPDAWADSGRALPEESIFSGVTVEDLAAGATRAARLAVDLERRDLPRRSVEARRTSVMLAETAPAPFSRAGWIFELKYDGFRLLVERSAGEVHLHYRRGRDATAIFPDIARALKALPFEAVLDGEVVVLDEQGRPVFQQLQKRVQLIRPADVERAAVERPATLFLFDLLSFEGFDLRDLPLVERKELLATLLPKVGPLRYCDHVAEQGRELYEQVRSIGLEGIMAKRADSTYRSGRHESWLKVRVERTADLVVVGFTDPRGGRSGFGALHLGFASGATLVYAGRVGTGFNERQLKEVRAALDADVRATPPCTGPVPSGRGHHWVAPRLVCEVRYLEWTEEGLLRQPAFLRFRDDKPIDECGRPTDAAILPEAPAVPLAPPRPVVPFSNLDKVYWPERGYTKGAMVDYYRAIAPFMLPFLADRPVVLTRYPDGIDGKSFFQVDAPSFVPDWLRTQRLWSEDSGKEVHLFLCDDVESLCYLANLGAILLHVWSSRVPDLHQPDWCVLDLDPKGAPFVHVVQVALAIRRLCESIELPAYVKSSGSSGLHILVPLHGQLTFEQTRLLADLLARIVVRELPEIATLARQVRNRGGRVYVDTGQNGHGKLIVAPYSLRPLRGAPVSAPLRWSEVNRRLDIGAFNIENVAARARKLRKDPLLPVLTDRPDLLAALHRLSEREELAPPR